MYQSGIAKQGYKRIRSEEVRCTCYKDVCVEVREEMVRERVIFDSGFSKRLQVRDDPGGGGMMESERGW